MRKVATECTAGTSSSSDVRSQYPNLTDRIGSSTAPCLAIIILIGLLGRASSYMVKCGRPTASDRCDGYPCALFLKQYGKRERCIVSRTLLCQFDLDPDPVFLCFTSIDCAVEPYPRFLSPPTMLCQYLSTNLFFSNSHPTVFVFDRCSYHLAYYHNPCKEDRMPGEIHLVP